MRTRRMTLTAAKFESLIAREAKHLSDRPHLYLELTRAVPQIDNLDQMLKNVWISFLAAEEHRAVTDKWILIRCKNRWTHWAPRRLLLSPTEYTLRPKTQNNCELE